MLMRCFFMKKRLHIRILTSYQVLALNSMIIRRAMHGSTQDAIPQTSLIFVILIHVQVYEENVHVLDKSSNWGLKCKGR